MKIILKFKLQKNQTHEGHCQINYYCKNDLNQMICYCLQDNGFLHGGVRLMRCSKDFEAAYEVHFNNNIICNFEKPKGDSKLELTIIDWIKNYENI